MRNNKKKFNQNTQALFDQIRQNCKTKRAKMGIKSMSMATDCSFYTALPGLINENIPNCAETVNILLFNASSNDILDHGRWLVLLGFMQNKLSLNINLWVVPKQGVVGETTKGRPIVDYIIENEYQGQTNTKLLMGSFDSVVKEIGLDKIDIVVNYNPDIDDHNTPESLETLLSVIDYGVPYIISDMSPLTLMFKLHIFNCWGITATKNMIQNRYGLAFKKGISATHHYMGFSYRLDRTYSLPSLISKSDKKRLEPLAASLISSLNIGEPLRKLPSLFDESSDGDIKLLEQFSVNFANKTLTCHHSGSKVSVSFNTIPRIPETLDESPASNSKLLLWILSLYQLFMQNHKMNQGVPQ